MTGQDDNPSETVGFGPAESELIRKTVRALKAKHTILVGCSLGGAAVWLASDEPGVSAVVSDSAFTRLDDACNAWLKKDLPGGNILLRPVIWFGTAAVGVKPSEVNPIEIAAKWPLSPSPFREAKGGGVGVRDRTPTAPKENSPNQRPALVIHGDQDRLFNTTHPDRLAKAAEADLWIVKDKGHAQPVDDPNYVEKLIEMAKRLR